MTAFRESSWASLKNPWALGAELVQRGASRIPATALPARNERQLAEAGFTSSALAPRLARAEDTSRIAEASHHWMSARVSVISLLRVGRAGGYPLATASSGTSRPPISHEKASNL